MPITKAFILEDDDFKVIEQKSQQMGDSSASAALRVIIREWHATQKSTSPVPAPALRPTPSARYDGFAVNG